MIVGIFGILLIIIAILIVFFSRFFSFFQKKIFIEKISEDRREKIEEFIKKDGNSQRYAGAVIIGILGLITIIWSQGIQIDVGAIFLLLAVVLFVINFLQKKFKKIII